MELLFSVSCGCVDDVGLLYGLVLAACVCGCNVLFHVSCGCGGKQPCAYCSRSGSADLQQTTLESNISIAISYFLL